MPKAPAKKRPTPVVPAAPLPAAATTKTTSAPTQKPIPVPDLPVLYDRLEIVEFSTASEKGPLTVADMKKALGWEDEDQFIERRLAENPGTKPEQWMADPKKKDVFGDVYHCKNMAGKKVRCNYNAQNRPFDIVWCEALQHTILSGQWAGPFTMPGETVNGETIRISKYGRVLSGQHQMTACILASEKLLKDREAGNDPPTDPKYPTWRSHGETFLETIVIRGVSENPKVMMTVDYNKPRSAADVFYTSDLFRERTPSERKFMCDMLQSGSNTLWARTDTKGYKTHPEVVAFIERHKRLLKCVELLFKLSWRKDDKAANPFTGLRLPVGQCAAVDYLMASSGPGTDGDFYRNELPPSEKNLDFSYWQKAEDFFLLLVGGPKGTDRTFDSVRLALGRLTDSTAESDVNQGQGGRMGEKLAILAKAWERWRNHPENGGPPFDQADLEPGGCLYLNYSRLDDKGNSLPNGEIKLLDDADFYGIDAPESVGNKRASTASPMPTTIGTREEIQAVMEAAAKRRGQVVGVDDGPSKYGRK